MDDLILGPAWWETTIIVTPGLPGWTACRAMTNQGGDAAVDPRVPDEVLGWLHCLHHEVRAESPGVSGVAAPSILRPTRGGRHSGARHRLTDSRRAEER